MTRTTAFLLVAAIIIVSGLAGVATPRSAVPVVPTAGPVDAGERPDGNLGRLSGAPQKGPGFWAPGRDGVPAVGGAPLPAVADAASGDARTVRSASMPAPTRQGTWAYANASHGPLYLAIPEGPGWVVIVCGPAACLERLSTDAGPELWLQRAGRIGDLSSVDFEAVCGVPISFGLCPGSYTIIGRPDQSGDDPPRDPRDDAMRIEDGGPAITLPPTDGSE